MIYMTLWQNIYYSAKEELEALKLRKQSTPNQRSIDFQIHDVENRLEEAKKQLVKTD